MLTSLPNVALSAPQDATAVTIAIDSAPRFPLSPFLYMQFMEPPGATDASAEAAWEHLRDDWREDVVEVTRELAPTMLRWGNRLLCSECSTRPRPAWAGGSCGSGCFGRR